MKPKEADADPLSYCMLMGKGLSTCPFRLLLHRSERIARRIDTLQQVGAQEAFKPAAALVLYFAGIRPPIHRRQAWAALSEHLSAQHTTAVRLRRHTDRLAEQFDAATKALRENPLRLGSGLGANRRIAKLTEHLQELV